ncbi:putative AAA family ATPase [Faustovirus]|nr:putative AAA family ATPase [Faustovirus]
MTSVKPKTAFEELIDVIMEISRVTLPFLAARADGGGNNMLLMIVMPIMMLVMRRAQAKVYSKIKPATLIIHECYKGDITAIYKTVKNYLLIKYADKFDMTCGHNYLIGDDGEDIAIKNTEASNIPSGIYNIRHNGNDIELEVSEDKTTGRANGDTNYNTIKLSHRNKAILFNFIADARRDEVNRIKPTPDKPRLWLPIYNWSGSQWSSMQIRITKKRDNLFLDPALDKALFNDIDKFLQSEDQYLERGLVWKRGYLFYGTPGCGKTSTGLALAEYTGRNIFRIKVNQILSSAEFDKACRNIDDHSIVILEEIDTIAVARSQRKLTTDPEKLHTLVSEYMLMEKQISNSADKTQARIDFVDYVLEREDCKTKRTAWSGATFWDGKDYVAPHHHSGKFSELVMMHLEKTFPSLAIKYSEESKDKSKSKFAGSLTLGDILTALDGNDCFYGCIVIATTNYPERLDGAMKRAGRIDMECDFKPANANVIRKIYETYLKRKPGFEIPESALITQSKLIHEYILTHEHTPELLDDKLNEYFKDRAKLDKSNDSATSTSPLIPRFDIM